MHFALRQSARPKEPLASAAASCRAEPGAVVSIEQPASASVSVATRAAADPPPSTDIFLGMADTTPLHSSARKSPHRRAVRGDYT
ncbi:hypothetical protein [Streptomyces sp. S8]|uniref:hypothetical protein n=1 Tax=Streptomyces sp. S8 TaxID=1837283 RepID=UPI001EF0612B|nr:hypothetical protein [Streptomyces sp. S8]